MTTPQPGVMSSSSSETAAAAAAEHGGVEKMLTEYTIQDVEEIRDLSLVRDIAKCHIQRSEYYQKQVIDTNEKLLHITKEFTEKCELDIRAVIYRTMITRSKPETLPIIVKVDRQYNINCPVVTVSVDTDALVNINNNNGIIDASKNEGDTYTIEDSLRIRRFNRVCNACHSNKTHVDNDRGYIYERWFRDKNNPDAFLCKACYMREYFRRRRNEIKMSRLG